MTTEEMYEKFGIKKDVIDFGKNVLKEIEDRFAKIDEVAEINQLKELYKKNGLDEYSDMAFLDENFNFDTDKWYIINMQFCDNTETPREYVLEIDEDFDATKLVAVYADVDLGGNLPGVEILSGLFYDGKPLTLYDEGDDEFLYAKNLIARFSKYKHSKSTPLFKAKYPATGESIPPLNINKPFP